MANPPLITRKGILTFDKQIDGQRGVGTLTTTPVPMGLLQQCVGVGWPSGFAIAALCSAGTDIKATIAVSRDGATGWSIFHEENAGAIAGIAGASADGGTVLIVGGYYIVSLTFSGFGDSPPVTFNVARPQFWISLDKGKSWTTSTPAFDTSFGGSFVEPGNGAFYSIGCINGMGYDPASKTFYATGTTIHLTRQGSDNPSSPPGTGLQVMYSGGPQGFSESGRTTLFTFPDSGPVPFHVIPTAWPSGIEVVDVPVALDATSPNEFVYVLGPNTSSDFVGVNGPSQHMSGGPLGNALIDMANDNTLSSTVGGVSMEAVGGTLTKKYLSVLDPSGNIIATPIDPAAGSPATKSLGAGYDINFSGPFIEYIQEASALTSLTTVPHMASISFSGAGKR